MLLHSEVTKKYHLECLDSKFLLLLLYFLWYMKKALKIVSF
jgi:hypothetical protein